MVERRVFCVLKVKENDEIDQIFSYGDNFEWDSGSSVFLKTNPAQFTIAYDSKGQTASSYKVKTMPSSFIIGRDGKVLYAHRGFRSTDKAALELKVVEAIKRLAP